MILHVNQSSWLDFTLFFLLFHEGLKLGQRISLYLSLWQPSQQRQWLHPIRGSQKSAKFCYPAHPPAVTHLVGTPVLWAETNFPTYPPHQLINKFAKLRRCASRVSFGSQKVCAQLTNSLTKLDFYVDVDVGHLVYLHVGHHVQLHVGHIFFYSGKS